MSKQTPTIHLTYSGKIYERLNRLSWKLKVPIDEVVGVAITMLQILVQATDDGSRLLIERKEGTVELSFLNLEDVREVREEESNKQENIVQLGHLLKQFG